MYVLKTPFTWSVVTIFSVLFSALSTIAAHILWTKGSNWLKHTKYNLIAREKAYVLPPKTQKDLPKVVQ